jgi:hypothetical protein
MADQILTYVTERRNGTQTSLVATQQKLATAQTSIATETGKLQKATADFADLEQEIAAIRQKLSAVPTPADGDSLLLLLEQAIISSRAKQAEILAAQTAQAEAQSEASLAQADLAGFLAQLASADTLIQQMDAASKQREAWIAALDGPLLNIKTDANSLSNAARNPLKAAKTRITKTIPLKLLEGAEERRTAEATRIANRTARRQVAETAVTAERDSNGGAAAMAADRWAELLRVEAAIRVFVNTAKSRVDQAQAILTQVAEETNAPLTAEQKARIDLASLKSDREAAADKEKAVTDARKDLEDKEQALDLATLAAKADPENVPLQEAVITAREKITNPATGAAKVLSDAQAAYTAVARAVTDAWEAAVPDATWPLVDDYESAVEVLRTMPDPIELKADLLAAETAYVVAQTAADKSADVLADLTAAQARRTAQENNARQNGAASLFSALRGDN